MEITAEILHVNLKPVRHRSRVHGVSNGLRRRSAEVIGNNFERHDMRKLTNIVFHAPAVRRIVIDKCIVLKDEHHPCDIVRTVRVRYLSGKSVDKLDA